MATIKKVKTDGEKLKAFRKKKGLSQTELADIVEKKLSTISKYERDDLGVPTSVIKMLSRKLNMSFEWWFDKDDSMDATPKEKSSIFKDFGKVDNRLSFLESVFEGLEKKFSRLEASHKVVLAELNSLKTGQIPVKKA